MFHKIVPFELTKADEQCFEGYASVFRSPGGGEPDLTGDMVVKGAFAKTIAERGSRVKVLWQHNTEQVIGRPVELREDDRGLFIRAKVSDTSLGRDVMALLRDGAVDSMSIGYEPVSGAVEYTKTAGGRSVRLLKEVKLWEVSLVTFPADEKALVTAVKAAIPPHTTEKAPDDTAWDAGAVMQECEGAVMLRRVSAWVAPDGDPDAKASYKLPHHLPDGRVVWRGVAAAMAALMGGRGGVDIPEADRRGVYEHLRRHYEQFGKEPPEFGAGKAYDFATAMGMQSLRDERWQMDAALTQSVDSAMADESMSPDERLAMIGRSLDQYRDAVLAMCMRLMSAPKSSSEPIGTKLGRVLSAANARRLQAALDSITEILRAAGLMDVPEEGEQDKGCGGRGRREDEGDAAKAAADSHSSAKAGPDATPPTAPASAAGPGATPPTSSEINVAEIDLRLAEIELALLEV